MFVREVLTTHLTLSVMVTGRGIHKRNFSVVLALKLVKYLAF